ncbi:MAG: glutamate--tRNA ligase [Candidatus Altiarchaeales archaeon]|nr:MAG: glutamate--tRNA ligase [Candidatus Altiarchaeales archaeon]
MDLETIVKKYALINAIKYNGIANPSSVIGKIINEFPEQKENIKELKKIVDRVVEEVNRLGLEEQKKELRKMGIEKIEEDKKKKEQKMVPLLKVKRSVVLRFAPSPNGPLHLGHARQAVVNWYYRNEYKGIFILRYDDTDPKNKVPLKKAYKWILEDLAWLKIKPDKIYYQSKRLDIYYKYFEKLIKMDKAYVCTCEAEKFRELRKEGRACPCRKLDPKENLKRWRKMLNHKFKEGEAVGRIKTDLQDKNIACRDWPAFRIIDEPKHPLVKDKHVWPLLDFASAIDDHEMGVTHIIRGVDLQSSTYKQRYIYEYFKWKYPIVKLQGKFLLADKVLSTSKIREGIEKGEYTGWDDPRLGTLRAFKKRGFFPEAIINMILEIGPRARDVTITQDYLASFNRKLLDPLANRYFFVPDPIEIVVENLPAKKVKLPLHPDFEERGEREIKVGKRIFIPKEDFLNYRGRVVRLIRLANIKLEYPKSIYLGNENLPYPKIQWVPSKEYVQVKVIMPDYSIVKGVGEINLTKLKPEDRVQFERFGFVKIESVGKNDITCYYIHD